MISSDYPNLIKVPSDIQEHLPVLRDYATRCNSVTEMGVRGIVSLWSWLDAKVPIIRAYDLYTHNPDRLSSVQQYALENAIDFKFYETDVLEVDIDDTDCLFIDTLHTYKQLKQELARHGNRARKYLIFHDTTLFGRQSEDNTVPGLNAAIAEFLLDNDHWDIDRVYSNNNGLTILKRG